MSRTVPDDAQGELQGILTSAAAVSMIVSPLIMTQTFAYFTGAGAPIYMPGAPFIVSMALMFAGIIVFLPALRSKFDPQSDMNRSVSAEP